MKAGLFRIFAGWWTARPRSSASSFTGGGVSFWPRPTGLSGWHTTPTTGQPASQMARSVGTANAGVPMKSTRWSIGVSFEEGV